MQDDNAVKDTAGQGAQPLTCAEGAPPSNTAPANCNKDNVPFKILRCAVDSLYLSFPGQMVEVWDKKFTRLKLCAQSATKADRDSAQLAIHDHIFEVKDRGSGMFRYVLQDNWYRICLAGKDATQLPIAFVQVSSEVITAIGIEQVMEDICFIINTFSHKPVEPLISRVDLCVDFLSSYPMDSLSSKDWVCRAQDIERHDINRKFSGFSLGKKGAISARLYDKTLELEKSKKFYLLPLWMAQGWEIDQTVWRKEFQYRRAFLKEVGIDTLSDLHKTLGSLWHYSTTEWLRLCIPNPDDNTPSRWPTHPLWTEIQGIDWAGVEDVPALIRATRHRVPSDEFLFTHGLGFITSFMVKNGIETLDEGLGEFIAQCIEFHDKQEGITFEKYLKGKLKEKRRRFNTKENKPVKDYAGIAERAAAYRKAKDGE